MRIHVLVLVSTLALSLGMTGCLFEVSSMGQERDETQESEPLPSVEDWSDLESSTQVGFARSRTPGGDTVPCVGNLKDFSVAKPDPTPWVGAGPNDKPDPTPWSPDSSESSDSDPEPGSGESTWGPSGKPDPTPWKSLR